jgi:hypothetical protein
MYETKYYKYCTTQLVLNRFPAAGSKTDHDPKSLVFFYPRGLIMYASWVITTIIFIYVYILCFNFTNFYESWSLIEKTGPLRTQLPSEKSSDTLHCLLQANIPPIRFSFNFVICFLKQDIQLHSSNAKIIQYSNFSASYSTKKTRN